MNFKEFNFSTKVESKKIMINNKEVRVLQYLPMEKKIDIIQIALQEAEEDPGVFNPMKLSTLMDIYMILFYTDIEIDDEDKADFLKLYDTFEINGVFDAVVDAIPEQEYLELKTFLETQQEILTKYKWSVAYMISTAIEAIPSRMEEVAQIINNFDPSKYQAVIDFATAANGGRPIPQKS